MPRLTLTMALLLLAGICTAAEPAPPVVAAAPIGRWMQPSAAPISPAARIFLVAGARDIANFAQEVVDQKRLWLARGYTPEQIECFYAVPGPEQRADVAQFLAIEEQLRDCHLASPPQVFDALSQIAAGYAQDHFYLYVTSHGNRPMLELAEPYVRQIDPEAAWMPQALAEARADPSSAAYAWLSPFQVAMEGVRLDAQRWGWASFFARLRQSRVAGGLPVHENLFTPKLLAAALQAFPAGVHKVVVIQACYSGGFVLPPAAAPAPDETLLTVQDITVLTAARADRTSFGCDRTGETTYYGRSLHKVLEANAGLTVSQLDWQQVHAQVNTEVEQLERQAGVAERLRSLPQFHTDANASAADESTVYERPSRTEPGRRGWRGAPRDRY